MSDREIDAEDGWVNVNTSGALRRLNDIGYSVGGYIDNGVPMYVLYRRVYNKFERVYESANKAEIDNIAKLLLEPTNEG